MPALSRTACVALADPDDPDKKNGRRLFLPAKTNIGRTIGGIGFSIAGVTLASGIKTSRAAWDALPVRYDADEALAASSLFRERAAPARSRRRISLLGLLRDGPKPVKDIQREAERAGFAFITIRRAHSRMGITAIKAGMNGEWLWALPEAGPAETKGEGG